MSAELRRAVRTLLDYLDLDRVHPHGRWQDETKALDAYRDDVRRALAAPKEPDALRERAETAERERVTKALRAP